MKSELDVALVKNVDHWAYYHSHTIIAENLQRNGWCRLIEARDPTYKHIRSTYGWDDWDILAVMDRDNIYELFNNDPGTWRATPILSILLATGVSAASGPSNHLMLPFVACAEVANMLCATKVLLASEFHRDVTEAHYRGIFKDALVDEIVSKIAVVPYAIDVPKVEEATRISEPVVIIFPHRTDPNKNPQGYVDYCEALRDLAPSLDITMRVPLRPRSKKWRQAEKYVNVEYSPKPLGRADMFNWFRSSDFVFSSAFQETYGLAIMEAVACGCWPILPDRVVYPEYHPQSCLYDTPEHAAQMTLDAIGQSFDNSYTKQHLWKNVVGQWHEVSQQTYNEFYPNLNVTRAVEKMLDYLKDHAVGKKELLRFMGWSSQKGWGKYRATLRQQGVSIAMGPKPTFGVGMKQQSLF
jgi:hypothetical protein